MMRQCACFFFKKGLDGHVFFFARIAPKNWDKLPAAVRSRFLYVILFNTQIINIYEKIYYRSRSPRRRNGFC